MRPTVTPVLGEGTLTLYMVGLTLFMNSGIVIAGDYKGGLNLAHRAGWRNGHTALAMFEAAYENKKVVPIHDSTILEDTGLGAINNKSNVPLIYVCLADAIAVIPKVKKYVYKEVI